MRDRMLVASTELTHDQASRNFFWGGGWGVEKNERTAWSQVYWLGMDRSDWTTGQSWLIVKYSLQQDWSWWLGPVDRLWPSAKAYLSAVAGAIYLSKVRKYMQVR